MIIQKNVRQTREKSCSMYFHRRTEKSTWWIWKTCKSCFRFTFFNACDKNRLMIVKKHRNDLNHFRSCENKKSESDCFTTTCFSMKPIHRKCALIMRQKTVSRCDSLKWLCWNWALYKPKILQWLRKSIEDCMRTILIQRNHIPTTVSCRTRKESV